jgi:hypothetical protein
LDDLAVFLNDCDRRRLLSARSGHQRHSSVLLGDIAEWIGLAVMTWSGEDVVAALAGAGAVAPCLWIAS